MSPPVQPPAQDPATARPAPQLGVQVALHLGDQPLRLPTLDVRQEGELGDAGGVAELVVGAQHHPGPVDVAAGQLPEGGHHRAGDQSVLYHGGGHDQGDGRSAGVRPGGAQVVETVGQGGHGQTGVQVHVVHHPVEGLRREDEGLVLDLEQLAGGQDPHVTVLPPGEAQLLGLTEEGEELGEHGGRLDQDGTDLLAGGQVDPLVSHQSLHLHILGQHDHLHDHLGLPDGGDPPVEGVQLAGGDVLLQQQFGDDVERLGPHEGTPASWNSLGASRHDGLLAHPLLGHQVELRHQHGAVLGHAQLVHQLTELLGLAEVAREDVDHGEVAVEQRPLALDVVEDSELPGLVVKPVGVLLQSLVAVPEEPLETKPPTQLGLDGVQCQLHQRGKGNCEGRET